MAAAATGTGVWERTAQGRLIFGLGSAPRKELAPTSRTEAIYTSHLIISRGSLPSVYSISLAGGKVLPYIGRDRFRFPTVQKLRSSVLRLLLTGTEQLPPPSLNRCNGSRGFPPNLIGSRRRERTRQLSRKLEANAQNDTSTHGSSRAR